MDVLKDFHKKEYNWVGYIINLDRIIYIAGDTDNIDEIRNIKCDIACVPIGGTYTMDVLEAVNLIKCIKRIAFGYRKYDHFIARIFLIKGIIKEE